MTLIRVKCLLFFILFSTFSFDSLAQKNAIIDSLTLKLKSTNDRYKRVLINYQLGNHYFTANDLSQAAKHAELSYNDAKELKVDSTAAKASNMWGIISAYQGKTEQAVRLLKESNRISIQLKDSVGITATYSLLSNVYNRMLNDPIMAFSYIDSAERYYQKGDVQKIIFGKIVKGAIFTNLSEYQYALEEYYSALDLAEGDSSQTVSLYINIGAVFYAMGNKENSLKYNKKALKLRPKSEVSLATIYVNTASNYYDKAQEDSAMLFINRAREIFEKNKNVKELFHTKIETCRYLLEFGKKDSAQVYFTTIDTLGLNQKEKLNWWVLSYRVGSPAIGLSDLVRKFHEVKGVFDDDSYLSVTQFLFEEYQRRGQFKKALEFKILYADRKDSIMKNEKIARGHAVELKRIMSAKNKEILRSKATNDKLKYSVQIEAERKQKWKYTTILLILISVTLVFSLFIVFKRKSDKIKFNKKELAYEKIQKEILINKLETAKRSVVDKNIEMESLLLSFSNNNLEKGSADTMMANLKDQNWSTFLSDFELIYPYFFDTISTHTTASLTKNERRLCALIKLNLSNKEMSEYVFVSQESIKKAKNRLFKKFKTPGTGQEISDFIRNV